MSREANQNCDVDALSQQYDGRIDDAVVREALGAEIVAPTREMHLQQIVDVVTSRYAVRLTDLQGKKRSKSIAFPRQICMYVARELTSMSLEEIGGYFGGRDHTTVLHARKTIKAQRENDPQLDRTLRDIIRELNREPK